jgi:hypothetical protein
VKDIYVTGAENVLLKYEYSPYFLTEQVCSSGNASDVHFFQWLFQPIQDPGLLFSSVIILQTVGLFGRVISPSQGRYLNTGQHKHRINAYTHQTSMPWVGFEPTIPATKRVKTVHALDRAATVTGLLTYIILFKSWPRHRLDWSLLWLSSVQLGNSRIRPWPLSFHIISIPYLPSSNNRRNAIWVTGIRVKLTINTPFGQTAFVTL